MQVAGSGDNQKLVAAALRRLERLNRQDAFDPANPESRPTPKQLAVFQEFGKYKQQYIRAGNQSGKSQTCARIVTWVLTDTHPNWKRPAEWLDEPLLVIVCGRTGKQIEDSLLPKIRSYLEPGTYKEVRIGNIVQRLELTNGHRIIFQSLENPNVARERLMSYVAHLTWCDELPPTMDLIRELLVRTQARNGYSLWSFTPTVVSKEIQSYVDSVTEPEGKVYRFHMLDNPLYSDSERKGELVARYSHLPQHVQDAIFEGEWLAQEDSVYYFNYAEMVEMPNGYSPNWRHVEAVDPATQSAMGFTLWAEDPNTSVWYCIAAEYIKGIYVPTEIVKATKQKTDHVNVVRRISDSEATWFIHQAAAMGINYIPVYKKSNRKQDLIKQLQEALSNRLRIAPQCQDLITEFQECRWSDRAEGKIVNSSSFHLLDSAQYFVDNIPKPEKRIQANSWQEWLYKANEERKVKEEQIAKKTELRQIRRRGRWHG